MNSSQSVFDGASQESVSGFSQKLIQRKTFSLTGDAPVAGKENHNKCADKNQDIHAVLNKILEKLDQLEKNQQVLSNVQSIIVENQGIIGKKLEHIEENLASKPEMMAQTKALMECKVSIKRVEGSVCRITGEVHDQKMDEVASMLPLQNIASVKEMEEKLEAEDFAQATLMHMHKIKGASEDVSSVIRGIFTDDLLQMYNWDGRWAKHSLAQLSICSKFLRDVFQKQSIMEFQKNIKKAVERSHNRQKQKNIVKKKKN